MRDQMFQDRRWKITTGDMARPMIFKGLKHRKHTNCLFNGFNGLVYKCIYLYIYNIYLTAVQ